MQLCEGASCREQGAAHQPLPIHFIPPHSQTAPLLLKAWFVCKATCSWWKMLGTRAKQAAAAEVAGSSSGQPSQMLQPVPSTPRIPHI
jgi:hypothetical protein